MKTESPVEVGAELTVKRIGGIDQTTVETLTRRDGSEGRNATNRTSLLKAIMAALGSDQVPLKGDADEGYVELTIGEETYTRRIKRSGRTTTLSGDPYLADSTPADLFAFLLESNDARQTVARGENLYDVIMRPVDTAEIERKIIEAERQKDELDDQLETLRSRREKLPDLRSKHNAIAEDLAEARSEREAVRNDIEDLDIGIEERQAERELHSEKLTQLKEAKQDLEETKRELESEKEQRDALKSERTELREERANIQTTVEKISDLGRRIGELQERRRALGSLLDRLQNIVQFNEEIMDDAESELREALLPADENVTDKLLGDSNLVCWTCSSTVERTEIEATLEELRALRKEKLAERSEISDELDDLRERKREMEQQQQRREQIEQQLEQIDDRLDQQSERIETLHQQRDSVSDRVAELEREVADSEPDNDDQLLELNKRENELTLTIERLEDECESLAAEIDRIEADVDSISEIEDERESVRERLTNLRNRIEELETDAVAAFNEHMDQLIDRLDYGNIDRIWIERRETTSGGPQSASNAEFELHVVRTTDDGAAYEDTIDHLSESEREVTGLVFALAGYLAHDIHNVVPFILLDSLEAIDSDRIATLVSYFEEYTDFLVVALLPEDAQALDETYHRVTEI
ncbi:archaea-specific SMC-related protein (plasmid) [Haloarcula sp. NS06]|uniref:archaea-specific SMC-related protein n=1 Tax=Haloarcula sp. NS06 TaxID=3409688 RepID=UPI003DA6E70A